MLFCLALLMAIVLEPPENLRTSVEGSTIPPDIAARDLWKLLPPVVGDAPIARFTRPICTAVIGVVPAKRDAIRRRIASVADTAAIAHIRAACTPNLVIAVVPDGRAFVRDLMRRHLGVLRSQSIANVRRILREPDGARAWVETEVRSRDGDRITAASLLDVTEPSGGPPMLATQGSSRLSLPYRRDIVSAVVVLDAALAATASAMTIADYAIMRGLLGAKAADRGTDITVLSTFARTPGNARATQLTRYDLALLRGVYATRGDLPAGTAKARMLSKTRKPMAD